MFSRGEATLTPLSKTTAKDLRFPENRLQQQVDKASTPTKNLSTIDNH